MNRYANGDDAELRKQDKAIYALLPYFQNAVLLGDSLAESVLDYRLLRKNNVVAKRGRTIDKIDGDLLMVYHLQPDIVFMEFGKNDIGHFHGDEKQFIQIYEQQIAKLYAHGFRKLYVNSIIPVRKDMEESWGSRAVFDRFNLALMAMCERKDITFIDNGALLEWRYDEFEFDGIHPKYPYYQKWLWHLIACAGLTLSANE